MNSIGLHKVQPAFGTEARLRLEKTIEAQRTQLLQAHGVLTCLYEVLLHAEGEEAVSYAQAGGIWTHSTDVSHYGDAYIDR